jgi:hypothetical protein
MSKSNRPARNASVTIHGIYDSCVDGTVTVWFRHCTVISFGAQQAALHDVGSDSSLRRRIYPREYGNVTAGHALDAGVVQKLMDEKVAWLVGQLDFAASSPQAESRFAKGVLDTYRAMIENLRAGRYTLRDCNIG